MKDNKRVSREEEITISLAETYGFEVSGKSVRCKHCSNVSYRRSRTMLNEMMYYHFMRYHYDDEIQREM